MTDAVENSPAARSPRRKLLSPKRRNVLLKVALVLGAFLAIRAFQTRDAARGMAPEISGLSIEGASLDLAAKRGTPVLVHFWATWCGVCKMEQGSIDSIAKDHEVITVSSQSGSPEEVRAYLAAEGLSMPVLNDPSGAVARAYGVTAFPSSFVVDGEGTIRHVEVGYTTEVGLRARLWLASL